MSNHSQRTAFLAEQRWFAGKGRDFEITGVEVLAQLDEQVRIELVSVAYAEGEPRTETYQMPVSAYPEHQERLGHALVRHGEGEWTYDALHDRDAMAVVYRAFAEGTANGVQVHRVSEPGIDTDADIHSTFLPAEQSNSSAVFGETAILKVFRKLTPGHNPDIEIHRALTEAGDDHVAHLYGWLSAEVAGAPHDLAMLQQFLRTASDGWELAKSSVRNLLTEADLHADEVGGDFGGEANRLGSAVAAVHRVLAGAFDSGSVGADLLAEQMRARLGPATAVVPELGVYRSSLEETFDNLAALGPVAVQRVHGDLHLGQTLRTSLGWKLVDFEGEPAKPLAERQVPDSSWRDVAGMVRSFHYAAASTVRDLEPGVDEEAQAAYRAAEWVTHNVTEFLAGYTKERGAEITSDEQVLLDAYIADKAIYEAAYEARNRPGWLDIPLAAIHELTRVPR